MSQFFILAKTDSQDIEMKVLWNQLSMMMRHIHLVLDLKVLAINGPPFPN